MNWNPQGRSWPKTGWRAKPSAQQKTPFLTETAFLYS